LWNEFFFSAPQLKRDSLGRGCPTMKTIEDIRNELAAIAAELRAKDAGAASDLDELNNTFYTTTTEYLVETMGLIQRLQRRGAVRNSNFAARLSAAERSARQLANLR